MVDEQHSADPGATMTFVAGGALKPIGGHILSHASATRLFLRKGECARVLPYYVQPDAIEQDVPKNASLSSLIVLTALRAKPPTSSTKVDGLMFEQIYP